MKTIYFDNNATTALAPEVREAILPYLNEFYGNPSSMHTFGGQVADAVENARETMANLLGDLWEGGQPDWPAVLALPGVRLHLYGKGQPRPGR